MQPSTTPASLANRRLQAFDAPPPVSRPRCHQVRRWHQWQDTRRCQGLCDDVITCASLVVHRPGAKGAPSPTSPPLLLIAQCQMLTLEPPCALIETLCTYKRLFPACATATLLQGPTCRPHTRTPTAEPLETGQTALALLPFILCTCRDPTASGSPSVHPAQPPPAPPHTSPLPSRRPHRPSWACPLGNSSAAACSHGHPLPV